MKKVLLSDIEGTLADSNSLHSDSWRRSFEHFGIDVGLDETWSQIGNPPLSEVGSVWIMLIYVLRSGEIAYQFACRSPFTPRDGTPVHVRHLNH